MEWASDVIEDGHTWDVEWDSDVAEGRHTGTWNGPLTSLKMGTLGRGMGLFRGDAQTVWNNSQVSEERPARGQH